MINKTGLTLRTVIGALTILGTLTSISTAAFAQSPVELATQDSIRRGQKCEELKPGQSFTVADWYSSRVTGVPRNYVVERDLKNSHIFHIKLSLGFFIPDETLRFLRGDVSHANPNDLKLDHLFAEGKGGYTARAEVRDAYIYKARKCYKEMRGRLRAQDGTELYIEADFPQNGNDELLTSIEIGLQERANSARWSVHDSCSTIIHETLHLLGLVDGYKELDLASILFPEAPATMNLFDCRAFEPNVSIMNEQLRSLGTWYEVFVCTGSKKGFLVTKVDKLEMTCAGTQGKYRQAMLKKQFEKWVDENRKGDHLVSYAVLPPPEVTLFPAQMRMITQPHCVDKNIKYINCSQNAYRTSVQGCFATPDYCRTGEFLY